MAVPSTNLARIGAIVFVAVAITATVVELSRKEAVNTEASTPRTIIATSDPLVAELTRCSEAGEAGGRDPACLHAWAENRRRFLAPGSRPIARMPEPDVIEAPRASEGG